MPDYIDYNMGGTTTTTVAPPGNRVADALMFREKQDAVVAARNPLLVKEQSYIRQKIEYYKFIEQKYAKGASKAEKISLNYLRAQKRFLQAQWNPKPIHKVLFHPLARFLRDWVTGYYGAHRHQEKEMKSIHLDIMQRRSYENISKALEKQGLQTNIEADLKQMIGLNLPSFSLPCQDTRNGQADFILHCRKIPGTDVYYMQKIDVVSRPADTELHKGNARNVTYTLHPGDKQALSAVQAANLVNGKMVCLEGTSWMRLDPARSQQEDAFQVVKFDLARALKDLPIVDTSRKALLEIEKGLKSGQQWAVELSVNNQPEKCLLTVLPGERRLMVQNREGHEILPLKPAAKLGEQQAQRAQQVMDRGLAQEAGRVVALNPGRAARH